MSDHDKPDEASQQEEQQEALPAAAPLSSGFSHRLQWNLTTALVKVDHPGGVRVSSLLQDVAKWTGVNFVMDPSLDRQVQIMAPHPLKVEESFELFLTGLQTVGLRALYAGPRVVKIVASPARYVRV
ncbi:MAG: hypothetical protein OXT67_09175 [Zetaproteobacteria bacterium]|nr:hypothetical protein [Zetaproteobacteria bacterium]